MPGQTWHQFLTGATEGDAITGHALALQAWLRQEGMQSELYAEHIHDSAAGVVRPLSTYRRSARERFAIYHHSVGSGVPRFLADHAPPLLLIYHNVTPPAYFAAVDPAWERLAALGQQQLSDLRSQTALALAVSPYNERDLLAAGYERTGVLPIPLRPAHYDWPTNEALAAELKAAGPLLLFVGRLAPNKKQEDLVRLLFFYRRLRPRARLLLIGDRWDIGYDRWIESMAAELGLAAAVELRGKVSQPDLVTCYRAADLYVSMSEHEGFGVPFLEAMYLDLPILAYRAAGVPSTLGPAGVMFRRKDYQRLAELVDILVADQSLRQEIISGQRERLPVFLEPAVRRRFLDHLASLAE